MVICHRSHFCAISVFTQMASWIVKNFEVNLQKAPKENVYLTSKNTGGKLVIWGRFHEVSLR